MISKIVVLAIAVGCAVPAAAQEVYVGHLGISWVRGRFNKTTSARIFLDRAARKGSIDVVIDATSVDTGHETRDKHVRSADYLDVDKFPVIAFKSGNLRFTGENLSGVDGELTMMGVTRPVSLNVTSFRCIQHPVNKRDMCGADASVAIKRSEWGIMRGATGIGDDVKISIQIEAHKE